MNYIYDNDEKRVPWSVNHLPGVASGKYSDLLATVLK